MSTLMRMRLSFMFILLFFCHMNGLTNGQRILYNKTYCNEGQFPEETTTVDPLLHAGNAVSISSSTFQAGKPITVHVKACRDNGFRAFLLRASVSGYYLARRSRRKLDDLGTIKISCGIQEKNDNYIHYTSPATGNILTFRWEPPFDSHGNITFHFTAVPKIPTVVYLMFGRSFQQGDENQVIVEQRCSLSSAASSYFQLNTLTWLSLLITTGFFFDLELS